MGRRQTRRGLVCYTLFSQIYAIFSNFLYFAASLDAKEGALQMSILQRALFCGNPLNKDCSAYCDKRKDDSYNRKEASGKLNVRAVKLDILSRLERNLRAACEGLREHRFIVGGKVGRIINVDC